MIILLGILIIHLIILVNLNFTAWPEMFSYSYLFSKGFVLYQDIVMPYPPVLVAVLTLVFKTFGFNILILKIFTWGLILLVDLLVYLILKTIIPERRIVYFLLVTFTLLQSFLDGNQLWFDFATVLPLLPSMYFFIVWLKKKETRSLIFVGFFLSITVLVKQIGLLYVLGFGSLYLILNKGYKVREVLYFLFGFIPAFLLFLVYLLVTNTFWDFWRWGIFYPLVEWSKFPGYTDLKISRRELLVLIGILLPLGFAFLRFKKLIKLKEFLFCIGILICTILAIYPRFSYFHLQPMIVVSAICYGYVASVLSGKLLIKYLTVIFIVIVLIVIRIYPYQVGYQNRFYTPVEIETAKFIQSYTKPSDRIFLLGLDSSIYAYADRLPAKPWVDNFGWYLEIPGIQEDIIERFEDNPPQVIFNRPPKSGTWYDLGVYRPEKISNYISSKYDLKDSKGEIQVWVRKN